MNESKASRYQRLRRRAHSIGVVSGAVMLAVLALTPAGRAVAGWAVGIGNGFTPFATLISLVLFVGVVVVCWELAALPSMLYLALHVDRRAGQGTATVDDVIAAQVHATLIALPATLVAAAVIVGSAALVGPFWWVLSGIVLAAALGVAIHGAPGVLVRVSDVRPVTRAGLSTSLSALAAQSKVAVAGIDEYRASETGRTTALVTGLGRNRRIFISSEVVRDWSDTEIAVVVAHELAHHAYHDLLRTLALDAVVLSCGLGASALVVSAMAGAAGAADLATLPLIALVAGAVWLAATPIRHAQSRRHERRADLFALVVTGGSDAFSSAIRRLGAQHLAEERPTAMTRWFFHRHPTVAERLAMAEAYRQLKVGS